MRIEAGCLHQLHKRHFPLVPRVEIADDLGIEGRMISMTSIQELLLC